MLKQKFPWRELDSSLGWLSCACWLVCEYPQIVQNYQTKRVESQSLAYWIIFCTADVFNLVGAILTHQVLPNIVLGGVFLFNTGLCVLQHLYYTHVYNASLNSYSMLRTKHASDDLEIGDDNALKDLTRPKPQKSSGSWCCKIGVVCICLTCLATNFFSGATRRRLLSRSRSFWLGESFGWMMVLPYFIAPIPQIVKTVRTKDVRDISLVSLALDVVGDSLYLLSVLLKPFRELTIEYITMLLPWIIQAAFTVLQMMVLFILCFKYRNTNIRKVETLNLQVLGLEREPCSIKKFCKY